jgi:hypothetical protein
MSDEPASTDTGTDTDTGTATSGRHTERAPMVRPLAVAMWLWVAIPFGYGLYQLVVKIPGLFGT